MLLPATEPHGVDVLAGLLAGARWSREEWITVPRSSEVKDLLWWYRIPVRPAPRDCFRISPFWGVCLVGEMPSACAARMLVEQPGDCPLLPLALIEALWGAGGPPHWLMPRNAWELPYACCHVTRKGRGWNRKYLQFAARRFGVANLPQQTREILAGARRVRTE